MSGIKDQHELDELRKRLYSRGFDAQAEQHTLTDEKINVARNWNIPTTHQTSTTPVTAPVSEVSQSATVVQAYVPEEEEEPARPRPYRKYVLIGTLMVALVGIAAAAAIFYINGTRISADNITLTIDGQNTVGSSETLSLQVGITNQNAVTVQDATLVLRYPDGTRTIVEPVKNVFEDRISIGTLAPGEAKNVPVQVAVFGKENDIREITATLEYRIAASGGMYYKEATPLKFQIISSPVSVQVSGIGKVSAGQPVEISLTVKSNTNKELKDVLVSASYPAGFTYKESEPKPIFDQNIWRIDKLKPEQSETVVIRGTINGLTEERFGVNFSVGLANTDNQFMVGSTLAEGRTEFVLENPFLAVDIAIDGDADRIVVLEPNRTSQVEVLVKNTLKESVYDVVVEVTPKGNAFSASSIDSRDGFYDSNRNVIRFDSANVPELVQLRPGESRKFGFSISPSRNVTTANFDVTANVYGRRVAEMSAEENLVGTVTATGKYSGAARLSDRISLASGPIPPKVGQTSTYLVTIVAEASSNNLTNAVVKTRIPTYVTWNNEYSGSGAVDFNPVTKELIWNAGDIGANSRKELTFSVNILPSVSQVGITPVLVNDQLLTATDRFTAIGLEAENGAITTELPEAVGYGDGAGKVEN